MEANQTWQSKQGGDAYGVAINRVADMTDADPRVSTTAKYLVELLLRKHVDRRRFEESGELTCAPSIACLAGETTISPSRIDAALAQLRALDILVRARNGDGSGTTAECIFNRAFVAAAGGHRDGIANGRDSAGNAADERGGEKEEPEPDRAVESRRAAHADDESEEMALDEYKTVMRFGLFVIRPDIRDINAALADHYRALRNEYGFDHDIILNVATDVARTARERARSGAPSQLWSVDKLAAKCATLRDEQKAAHERVAEAAEREEAERRRGMEIGAKAAEYVKLLLPGTLANARAHFEYGKASKWGGFSEPDPEREARSLEEQFHDLVSKHHHEPDDLIAAAESFASKHKRRPTASEIAAHTPGARAAQAELKTAAKEYIDLLLAPALASHSANRDGGDPEHEREYLQRQFEQLSRADIDWGTGRLRWERDGAAYEIVASMHPKQTPRDIVEAARRFAQEHPSTFPRTDALAALVAAVTTERVAGAPEA
jgi:hypothetical protein